VDHIRIRQFLADLYARGAKKSSVARRLAAVRSFFRYLEREGRIGQNPARLVSSPKLPRTLPSIPAAQEVNRMLDQMTDAANVAFPARDRAMVELLYGSGLRVSELVGLDLRDIDFTARTLMVKGKGRKERLVPYGSKAAAALQAYLPERSLRVAQHRGRVGNRSAAPARAVHAPGSDAGRGNDGARGSDAHAVFVNTRGRRLSTRSVARLVKAHALRLGLPSDLHPHSFRHAFASHLLAEGADLRAIQEMLGHKSLSTTQKYTQTSIGQLMELYDRCHPKA
jgi:integrase/recombinase XerC